MNWDAFGAISEFLGAVAVLLTLIYLAMQMRHSAKAVAAQTYESIMSGYNELNLARATDPELARLFNRGLMSPVEIEEKEIPQLDAFLTCFAVNYFKIYKLYEKGVIEKQEIRQYASEACWMFESVGGSVFLERNPNWKPLLRILRAYRLDASESEAVATASVTKAESDA
jgi:hypothetical protein